MRNAAFALALVSAVLPAVSRAQTPPAGPAPSASPAASPAPAVTPSAATTARAKEWLHRIQTDTIDRTQLASDVNSALTDDLAKALATQLGPLGDPTAFDFLDSAPVPDGTAYRYKATFKSTALIMIFAQNAAGTITGMRFLPAQ